MIDFSLEDPTIAFDLQLEINAQRKSYFDGDRKKVWFSSKMTPEERKPVNVIHRAHELISQYVRPTTRVDKAGLQSR